jgi:hypothetical protein
MITWIYFASEIYKLFAMPAQILRAYLEREKVESESKAIVHDKNNENNEQIQFKKECSDQETESRPKRRQYFENWKKIAFFLEILVILFTVPALWSTWIQIFFTHNLVFGFLRMATFYVAVGAFLIDCQINFIDQFVSLSTRRARLLPDSYPDSILNRSEPWRKFIRLVLVYFAFHQAYPIEFEFDFYVVKLISLFVTLQQLFAKKISQTNESPPKNKTPLANIKQMKKSRQKGKNE